MRHYWYVNFFLVIINIDISIRSLIDFKIQSIIEWMKDDIEECLENSMLINYSVCMIILTFDSKPLFSNLSSSIFCTNFVSVLFFFCRILWIFTRLIYFFLFCFLICPQNFIEKSFWKSFFFLEELFYPCINLSHIASFVIQFFFLLKISLHLPSIFLHFLIYILFFSNFDISSQLYLISLWIIPIECKYISVRVIARSVPFFN